MRRKPLPPPPDDLGAVDEAKAAVPLVPGTEADCCARLQGRLSLAGRDDAATWLAFLETLGLVEEAAAGFARVRAEPDADALAEAFLESVLGAREALEALQAAPEPLEAPAVADRIDGAGPAWERQRHGPDWPATWEQRTHDLLGWLALLGLAERTPDGYRAPAD